MHTSNAKGNAQRYVSGYDPDKSLSEPCVRATRRGHAGRTRIVAVADRSVSVRRLHAPRGQSRLEWCETVPRPALLVAPVALERPHESTLAQARTSPP